MQAKKSTKILSALSMAAMSVIGAKTSHGATLTMYYGQDPLYANSNNSVQVGSTFTKAGVGTDLVGGKEVFTAPTLPAVSQTAVTTITIPVGDYLSLAIDAVLTGNPNSPTATSGQPANMGLSELSLQVFSTDSSATFLTPISIAGKALSTFGGQNTYVGFGNVNTTIGPNGQPQATGASLAPVWASVKTNADVSPNEPGFDPGAGNGQVGLNGAATGGNTAVTATPGTGTETVAAFGASTASYANATEFQDSIMYQGLTAGTVTLTPTVKQSGTQYWTNTGTSSGISAYAPKTISGSDTINSVPKLVIVVGGVTSTTAPTSHAIVALAATANSNYGTTITNGTGVSQGTFTPPSANTLTLTGGSGKYNIAQVTGISTNAGAAVGNVNVSGWNPASDPEIFGVDVKVNGTNASPSQLATLIAAIGGAGVPASTGVVASTVDPTGVLAALDTATTSYNLFLTFAAGGPGAADNLNLDLSTANDAGLQGYTFSAVSVVPEPVSLGLLAIGGLGLMSRRTRRKS